MRAGYVRKRVAHDGSGFFLLRFKDPHMELVILVQFDEGQIA